MSDAIDGDDNECADFPEPDDRFDDGVVDCNAVDDKFPLASLTIRLPFDDLAREDGVFEIKDCEVVIFQFVSGVSGYNVIEVSD